MAIPRVVFAGRPNVGKSSLFNMLVKSRVSIVDAFPGVTRDRVSHLLTHEERTFELVDTGGVGIVDSQGLEADVNHQIDVAFSEADVIVFVTDARDGVMPGDMDLARRLRELGRPVILVANKVDSRNFEPGAVDFFRLGFGAPILTSATSASGRADLVERISHDLELVVDRGEGTMVEGTKLAIVGKRNAGKSTLINHLCGEHRVITSEVPGTTRDCVDVLFARNDRHYIAIDTAGMRREKSVQNSVEFYSQSRTKRAIRRADVVLFLVDAATEISRVDKKLGDLVVEAFKPVIVVVNKWDIARERGATPDNYETYLADRLAALTFAPIACASAKTGLNTEAVLTLADELAEQSRQRISTGELNRTVERAYRERSPRPKHGKIGKILYATQIEVAPPTILLFVNARSQFDATYLRYMTARIREDSPFGEVPVRLFLKGRSPRDPHPGGDVE